MIDYVDLIFKSNLFQQLVIGIKTLIMALVMQNQFIYLLVWLGVSIAIAFYLSTKAVSKVIHIITYAVLIFLSLKYIGII